MYGKEGRGETKKMRSRKIRGKHGKMRRREEEKKEDDEEEAKRRRR